MATKKKTDTERNVCEHGDHPAPENQMFCSPECQECEMADCEDGEECAGICGAENRRYRRISGK